MIPDRAEQAVAIVDAAAAADVPIVESPPTASDHRLVIYEDPSPLAGPGSSHEPSDHMLCTYQCRQMVHFSSLNHYHQFVVKKIILYFLLLILILY